MFIWHIYDFRACVTLCDSASVHRTRCPWAQDVDAASFWTHRSLKARWKCCLNRADSSRWKRHHLKAACVCVCVFVILFAHSSRDLCHVNNNERSQDFNGNIISYLFVLSLALEICSFPVFIQQREGGWKRKVVFEVTEAQQNAFQIGHKCVLRNLFMSWTPWKCTCKCYVICVIQEICTHTLIRK